MTASFDTRIEGDPTSVRAVATWLTGELSTSLNDVDQTVRSIAGSIGNEWRGEAATTAADRGWDIAGNTNKAINNITDAASAINTFASQLEELQEQAADIRNRATMAGLIVQGTVVTLPDNADAQTTDSFQSLSIAATNLQQELPTHERTLESSLSAKRTLDIFNFSTAIISGTGEGLLGGATFMIAQSMRTEGSRLLGVALKTRAAVLANPVGFGGACLANQALNQTDDMARAGSQLIRDSKGYKVKVPKVVGGAGLALAGVGTVLGAKADMAEGESATQAWVSQGAGTLASIGAAAATGAALGTFVPGVGNVVGGAIGLAVGIGAACFTDGFVDSLFENGADVGKAFKEGAVGVVEGGKSIGRGAAAVGEGIADGAKSLWNSIF